MEMPIDGIHIFNETIPLRDATIIFFVFHITVFAIYGIRIAVFTQEFDNILFAEPVVLQAESNILDADALNLTIHFFDLLLELRFETLILCFAYGISQRCHFGNNIACAVSCSRLQHAIRGNGNTFNTGKITQRFKWGCTLVERFHIFQFYLISL